MSDNSVTALGAVPASHKREETKTFHGIKLSKDGNFIYFGSNPVPRDQVLGAFGGTFNPGMMAPSQRKFANPAPLGLSAFALTTFVLSLVNIGTRGVHTPNVVVGLACFYGGFIQLLAGMWEIAVENTFGGTALSSYGGFWMSWAAIQMDFFGIKAAYSTPQELQHAVGFFLAGWLIFTIIMTSMTAKSTWMFFALFFFLTITFIFLTTAHFFLDEAGHINSTLNTIGGSFGVLTAFIAWYNAYAGIAEPTNAFVTIKGYPTPWNEMQQMTASDQKQKLIDEVVRATGIDNVVVDSESNASVRMVNVNHATEAVAVGKSANQV